MKRFICLLFSLLCVSVLLPFINLFFGTGVFNKGNLKELYSLDYVIGEFNYYINSIGLNIDNNIAIVGKDGFLFLGNNYDRVTDLHRGFLSKTEEINKTVPELVKKQIFFDSLSIPNIFVIAPDKYTIYKDKLPPWLTVKDKRPVAIFMEEAKSRGLHALQLEDYFQINTLLSFYKTDTHWNSYGSYIGYLAAIDYLNKSYDLNLKKIEGLSFSFSSRSGGDLANFMKYASREIDLEAISDLNLSNIKKCHYDLNGYQLNDCKIEKNSISHTNTESFYTKNENALNDYKLLYLKDSFGTENSIFYQETFKETIQFHYNNLVSNELLQLVLEEQPDFIIFQVVERGFYTAGYSIPWNNNVIRGIYLPELAHISPLLKSAKFNDFIKENVINDHSASFLVESGDPFFTLNLSKLECSFEKININMHSSVSGDMQIFYKIESTQPYSEENSTKIRVIPGENEFSLNFSPVVDKRELRFDFPSDGGRFEIKDFSFYSQIGKRQTRCLE
ncbi:acetyltransferase AlgX (SGNH hydrolase-like protein) [Vibrio diazotrophicus]|uniref:Acetyltransferase AlgX (SGNH hydrolase-like protein) n=1 Tax=Vibrio diazotrophicus TaxID=685 RepID=A0A329DS85_VIBDI|nr:hypothetical protein [Vibrio diazotrophicus]RAS52425.1 acetyltransferase AlgX (SGNH hydrolase-like protein) [Vibrio diazotrophicus]